MYVVSSVLEGKYNGQISNTVFQVTSDPPKITVCLSKENLTHQFVRKSGLFSVSVLTQDAPMTFIGKFGFKSGKDVDKFKDTKFIKTDNGIPVVVDYSCAWLCARVVSSVDVGTHTLFIGEMVNSARINDIEPMTYEYYHLNLKGKSPKNAPTYERRAS